MADKVTVTSRHSYGSRVKNSFGKIGGGFLLVIASIFLIFKNEQNFLQTKVALNEGAKIVQETVSTEIDPSLDGAEVHLYGETSSPAEALQDVVFGVKTDDLKLQREVLMYQWIEESEEHCTDNLGGSEDCETTYTYTKGWEDHAIDSSSFYESAGHENPTYWKYESQEWEKSPILLGVYTLTDVFTYKLSNYKTLNLSLQNIVIPEEYKIKEVAPEATQEETNSDAVENNNDSYLYGDTENTETEVVKVENKNGNNFYVHDSYIYIGNEQSPAIGDMKIIFSSVKTGTISVVGQQYGDNLNGYTASNGKTIALLSEGKKTAEDMFIEAQQANKMMTWIFRLLLLVMMFAGFSMIFEFITTLAKVLPFLSRIIGVGTGIIAFACTLVFGFLAIGISRLAVRPVVGISCLAVAAFGIVMLVRAKKNKKLDGKGESKGDDKNVEIIEA